MTAAASALSAPIEDIDSAARRTGAADLLRRRGCLAGARRNGSALADEVVRDDGDAADDRLQAFDHRGEREGDRSQPRDELVVALREHADLIDVRAAQRRAIRFVARVEVAVRERAERPHE